MEIIQIGNKFESKYDFRETCFGIVEVDNQFLVVKKNNQYSLIGGGIEENESFEECLKREFIEESGYKITETNELVCVDCYWLAANKYPMQSKANIYIVKVDLTNSCNPLETDCIPCFISEEKIFGILPLPYHKEAIKYYFKKTRGV